MSKVQFPPVPPEPAHPMVVRLYDELVTIYNYIRSKYQVKIDQAFDEVSQQIGFVVTTSVPVSLEVGAKESVMGVIITDGSPLKNTLFDRALTQALKGIKDAPIPKVSPGTYKLYLFWYKALKLKLRTDWMEPVHYVKPITEATRLQRYQKEPSAAVPGVREPAHWFDPGIAIDAEEAVLIEAIDEVYPEVQLANRVAYYREVGREKVIHEVKEPAHFQRIDAGLASEDAMKVLSELASVLRRYGY